MPGGEIEQYGSQHHPVAVPEHQPEHRRKGTHQDDIERQHVEVQRLVPEQQPLRDGFDRGVQQGRDIESVDETGRVEPVGEEMDGSQIEHEQQNVGGVDLPHAPQ